ncbi:MAG: hypothetical protein ACI3VY_03485 [Faecousia sp.]
MKRIVLIIMVGLCILSLVACSNSAPTDEEIIMTYISENIGYDLDEIHVVREDSGFHVTMTFLGEVDSLQQLCENALCVTNTYSQENDTVINIVNPSVKNSVGDFYGWSSEGLLYSNSGILEKNVDCVDISYYLFSHGIIGLNDANLSEDTIEKSFVIDLEQALVDGRNSDSAVFLDSSDEFILHYQKMIAAIYGDIRKYEGATFENSEFQEYFDLFYGAVTDAEELLNTSPYDVNTFLSSWYKCYWNMCCAVSYFYSNHSLQIDDTNKYMLQIADISLVSSDDILPYQGGWTTYKYYQADTNPNIVVDGYTYTSLHYDFKNKNAVTSMVTFYLFGINPDGSIIMVNSFMQPRSTMYIVDDGHIIEDDEDYYRIEGYSGSVDSSMLKKAPEIGMTMDEVLASTWGGPNKRNKTETVYGTHEQWVYNDRGYIYFDNGIVTAIQTK